MKRSLVDRVTALETAMTTCKPRRVVYTETIYADDDEAEEERKRAAAVDADRKITGWEGDYIVIAFVDTHAKDGTWINPCNSPRRKREEAAALAASTTGKHH